MKQNLNYHGNRNPPVFAATDAVTLVVPSSSAPLAVSSMDVVKAPLLSSLSLPLLPDLACSGVLPRIRFAFSSCAPLTNSGIEFIISARPVDVDAAVLTAREGVLCAVTGILAGMGSTGAARATFDALDEVGAALGVVVGPSVGCVAWVGRGAVVVKSSPVDVGGDIIVVGGMCGTLR